MKLFARIAIPAIVASFVLPLAIPAHANSIAITYSLTGMGTVVDATDTTLTLVGQFSGSFLSNDSGLNAAWNPVTYTDHSVADLTTGLLNGNFSFVFANGDMLSGNVFEDVSAIIASPDGTGPFTQRLSFTGGTGEFAGATGSASGNGFAGTETGTVSGTGTLNTAAVPEPASPALLVGGLALLFAGRLRLRSGKNDARESRRKL
jgi:hypothetical protein